MAEEETPGNEHTFLSHLVELRDRLLKTVLAVLIVFLVLFPFGNQIYLFIAGPMMAALPEGSSMIATQVASPFLTPFKLTLVSAIFLAMPLILYQFWGFIAPGLYQHEKKMAFPLLVSSILLFYLGAAFAYFVVFPLVFTFLTGIAPEGVAVMTDITAYLDFVLTLFFAFGIAFEVPIATILLVWMGMTTPEKLVRKRAAVIVGAFVIGMLLTPPDVISQTLLALPMWVLFELGVIFSRFFVRKKDDDEEVETDSEDAGVAATATAGANPGSAAETATPADSNDEFVPLTEEELEAEFDNVEAEMDELDQDSELEDEEAEIEADVDQKLKWVNEFRDQGDTIAARQLLYQVLAEGDETQVMVAKNILEQLDD
ncbi:MAG: twin-arginine translocase subunit TatC [bacterium]